jgi:hypothetical protein
MRIGGGAGLLLPALMLQPMRLKLVVTSSGIPPAVHTIVSVTETFGGVGIAPDHHSAQPRVQHEFLVPRTSACQAPAP